MSTSVQKSAFVLGATGAVGRILIDCLVDSRDFSRVVIFTRRNVSDFPKSNKLEQKIVDFDQIESYSTDFKGLDVGFSCLGSKRGTNQKEYYKVDHDYVVNTAKVAKNQGVEEFAMVSSRNPNVNSWVAYSKLKGEIERDITALGFKKTIFARPGLLEGRPEQSDPNRGTAASVIIAPLKWMSDTWAIKCEEVAKAMIVALQDPTYQGTIILKNAELIKRAKDFQSCTKL